ncbi:MarR family winged helix-turn-helix transcriptional regulator [Pimelobacter simplex]|uniref:MarR family winged helix-turn-helix transcriptional regulator n=1 Tax=Nocardioides simplex TaxID=2045 RepID=UPI00214FCD7A|nr:MarR family transcriptional regulator [Pimelobacter simplex]UUW90503.1 MarR family transcriptional regulator [Pimelobacter simplex]UUW94333.1 MarR family transcriptional regulator [Pimelobacter simplex]
MAEPNLGMQFAFAFRALADRHAEVLAELLGEELKPAHAYLLRAVAGAPYSVGGLAELLQVTKQAASQMVDLLEGRGLVARAVNPTDRRAREVTATDRGRSVLATADQAWRTVEDEVAGTVGARRYAALTEALATYLAVAPPAPAGGVRPVW